MVPYTMDPEPQVLGPKPEILNPKPLQMYTVPCRLSYAPGSQGSYKSLGVYVVI